MCVGLSAKVVKISNGTAVIDAGGFTGKIPGRKAVFRKLLSTCGDTGWK